MARYKVFAREKGTRLIERGTRVGGGDDEEGQDVTRDS